MILDTEIMHEISQARIRAHEKHGSNSIEAIGPADARWLPILAEEFGEIAHELTYDSVGSLRAELIDLLAVATAWVSAIDRSQPTINDNVPVDPALDTGCEGCE